MWKLRDFRKEEKKKKSELKFESGIWKRSKRHNWTKMKKKIGREDCREREMQLREPREAEQKETEECGQHPVLVPISIFLSKSHQRWSLIISGQSISLFCRVFEIRHWHVKVFFFFFLVLIAEEIGNLYLIVVKV